MMDETAPYVPRTLRAHLEKANAQFPVVLVTGARQVGKTTFLRHTVKAGVEPSSQKLGVRRYVTLDDPLACAAALEEPELFLQRFPPPVLIDEIQYAPNLLRALKLRVDEHRVPGLFWITGSQQFRLMKGVSESLAGRAAVVELLGLSRRESLGLPDPAPFLPTPDRVAERVASGGALGLVPLYRRIWRGSFPEVALNAELNHQLFYSSYVQTYLGRDVRDLARVGDEAAFTRFLRASAARTGQLLNIAELARDVGIAPNTAKAWLSILQTSGIVYVLEPFHTNLTKRLVKTPKLYFLDTGLCAFLTGWSSPETLEAGAMSGAILETWFVTELLKSWLHHGQQARFYFYRDKDQREIDLIIEQDGTLYPVEFKKTARPSARDVRHFHVLDKLGLPVGPGGLVCLAEQDVPLSDQMIAIPAAAL